MGAETSKNYSSTRALVESVNGGTHKYITEGIIKKNKVPTPQGMLEVPIFQVINQGWSHENSQ